MSGFPRTWAETDLGSVYELNYGRALPQRGRDSTGVFPVFGSSGVVGYHSSFMTKGPVIIVGRKGAAGAVSYARENCWPIDTTYFVKPPDGIDCQFAFYQLKGLCLDHLEKSTAIPGLSRDDAYRLRIWMPPTQEQRRIVTKLEELLSELDKAVENLTAARVRLKAYQQSILKYAFEGCLTGDGDRSNWRPSRVGAEIDYLTSGSRGWADYYASKGAVFIRAQDLKHDRLNLDECAFVDLPAGSTEGTRTLVQRGDVLITITGANVTKTGLVDRDIGRAYVSQHVALCRPRAALLPAYLYWYLLSESGGRRQLTEAAYGAGKPGLNLENIRSVSIPVPGIEKQREIVSIIESGADAELGLNRIVSQELERVTTLRHAILKRAFSGRLVPQDAKDEPASVLLERIRSERARSVAKTTKTKQRNKGEAA